MKPAFWLLLLFLLASGLSAWIGNDWGRHIGKRKLSVFALRPKHTSSFLTILLSMALSLGFFGLYLLADPRAREALLLPETSQLRQSDQIQQQASDFSSTLQRLQRRGEKPANDHKSENGDSTVRTALLPKSGMKQTLKGSSHVSPQRRGQDPVSVQPLQRDNSLSDGAAANPQPEREFFDDKAEALPRVASQPVQLPARQTVTQTRPQVPAKQTAQALRLPAARQAQPHPLHPESAAGSWQRRSNPNEQLAMLEAPIFKLRVYGGRTPAESSSILDGVLTLTRAYALDLGLSGAGEPLLLQPENLDQSRLALEKQQIYQLQVQIGRIASTSQSLPVRLVLQPESPDASFDPQQLLEQTRLNPEANQSLQADLRQAILAMARQTRQNLQLEDISEAGASDSLAQARLPIQIMQLHRIGNTLQGQIVLAAEASNLTEN
ncbi:MAG: DUF3084 domain-containing protein [Candidatus Sericytochromatia bacterium]